MATDLLLFGYGSLIFRPEHSGADRCWGWLQGFERRFWQASPDHRGRPEAPGRVLTLVEADRGRCFGVVDRIPAAERVEVLARLDHRERAGYERLDVRVQLVGGGAEVNAVTYRAASDNPNFLGPAPLSEQVAQVQAAWGESGSNRSYILQVDQALRERGVLDPEVHRLAVALRALPEAQLRSGGTAD